MDKARQVTKYLSGSEDSEWYNRYPIITIAGRVSKLASLLFIFIFAFLSFAYYPYHLQMRRFGTSMKAHAGADGVATWEGGSTCPLVDKPVVVDTYWTSGIKVRSKLGTSNFDMRDEQSYETHREEAKSDFLLPLSNVWETLQITSKFLAISEWWILAQLIIICIAALMHTGVSSLMIFVPSFGNSPDEKMRKFVKQFEMWSGIFHLLAILMFWLLATSHIIFQTQMGTSQLTATAAYKNICLEDPTFLCFEGNRNYVCDLLSGDRTAQSCDTNSVIPDCSLFGQSVLSPIDVLSFGQKPSQCGLSGPRIGYCPPTDKRDTLIQMASKLMWDTGAEGARMDLGVEKYSYHSTQGILVSLIVFYSFICVCTFIEVAVFGFGFIMALQSDGGLAEICACDCQTLTKCFNKSKDSIATKYKQVKNNDYFHKKRNDEEQQDEEDLDMNKILEEIKGQTPTQVRSNSIRHSNDGIKF